MNVRGAEAVLQSVKNVFSSLFTERAISCRVHQGFRHAKVAILAGVQRLVRSCLGASGVMFTLDTESEFPNVLLITATYGLGEFLVQGVVSRDEFYVYKQGVDQGRTGTSVSSRPGPRP